VVSPYKINTEIEYPIYSQIQIKQLLNRNWNPTSVVQPRFIFWHWVSDKYSIWVACTHKCWNWASPEKLNTQIEYPVYRQLCPKAFGSSTDERHPHVTLNYGTEDAAGGMVWHLRWRICHAVQLEWADVSRKNHITHGLWMSDGRRSVAGHEAMSSSVVSPTSPCSLSPTGRRSSLPSNCTLTVHTDIPGTVA